MNGTGAWVETPIDDPYSVRVVFLARDALDASAIAMKIEDALRGASVDATIEGPMRAGGA